MLLYRDMIHGFKRGRDRAEEAGGKAGGFEESGSGAPAEPHSCS